MRRRFLLALVGCLAAGPVLAQWSGWDYENDREKKPWSELQVKLPPYPKPSNLIRFNPGRGPAHRFYLDATSVSVGKDGVVRYTLVIKTAGGATNISYDGMRCAKREVKIYAVGNDGAWVKVRDPEWRRIDYRDISAYDDALYSNFLCPENAPVRSAEQAIERLKHPDWFGSGD